MMNLNQLTWSFKGEQLLDCRNGIGLAERYIRSLANEAEIHKRTELASILAEIKRQGQLETPAAEGFMSKINFALKAYSGMAA